MFRTRSRFPVFHKILGRLFWLRSKLTENRRLHDSERDIDVCNSRFFFVISNRYRKGRYIRITYKGKRRIIRRITRRFKIRVGYKRWAFVKRRRGRLVVRCRGRYRRFRITRRVKLRYGRNWRTVRRKPRGRRGRRKWRRRQRRRRRRRIRRRRRRNRRRIRRRRRLNILRFKYGRKWIRVFRWGRYLRGKIRRMWRRIR